ncbi:hypothetical protein [Parafrankia elaeagni]|uniref:hypothetical protein n=1 Tax=Parafrankia elaeagni TaxID=222534 RepID=UPI00037336C5|nr:hypothetical protein [Parafrankia elaeagni]
MTTLSSPDSTGEPFRSSKFVTVSRARHVPVVDHGVTIDPCATVADVSAALALLPAGAVFAEHFGDVEVTLLFREMQSD